MYHQEIETLSPDVKRYFALQNAAKTWWNTKGHPRYERQLEIVTNEIEAKGKVVLDVGTGRGRFAIQYVRNGAEKVIAIEISNGMLEIAKENARSAGVLERINFLRGDVEEYLFQKESIDIINCMEVYVHLPNPQKVTKQFFSYLLPGGVLIANFDLPLTKKWYFHWLNEPFRSFRRWLQDSFLYQVARHVYFIVLPAVMRNYFHNLMGWPNNPGSPIHFRISTPRRQLPTTRDTIDALRKAPDLMLSRAEDAINRMELANFIEIINNAGFQIERVICERKWFQLPYGYIVIGRKKINGGTNS
jgi:ubiquinone/menaquinone biosynthesis C-methylase UbiE